MVVATFPADQFLYAKLDRQMRYVYCNAFHEQVFLRSPATFMGQNAEQMALQGAAPAVMLTHLFDTVRSRGFANAILPFEDARSTVRWGMIDITRRFGADNSSGQLGYEYVAYPTTEQAIHFFAPLAEQLQQEEKRGNSTGALKLFQESIQRSGMIYEELVHTLQAQ